ncbi:MAG: sugar phosphate isomerase/epimerase [Imperialibacter sp.]|uniref:sugar phosphate isomerase/epimerase family protein n=1 Tax=Imperialibacter sp. TaxID=2038411 RepID=UPI0032EB576E
MKNNEQHLASRRSFIGKSATAAAGILVAPSLLRASGFPNIIKSYGKPDSMINGVQLGVITYSFRSLPDQSAEATLKYIVDCGISAVELMGDPAESFAGKPESTIDRRAMFGLYGKQRRGEELTDDEKKQMADMQAQSAAYNKEVAAWRATASMDKFAQVKKMYNDAGVQIYAFKPNAFGKDNTDAEVIYGLKAAKALGASHVTLEHPSDDAQTLRLGALAAKQKVSIGYHGHEQQTPTLWDTALKQSKYNGLNLDLGHFVAAGNADPLGMVKAKADRILSMHMKDRQNPEHGKKNLVWGTGDTPLTEVLQLMSEQKYKFPGTIELEYEIPEGSDAVKEVQKCVEYCRKALA